MPDSEIEAENAKDVDVVYQEPRSSGRHILCDADLEAPPTYMEPPIEIDDVPSAAIWLVCLTWSSR